MLATILGILCGAVLGFRFKVLILVPMTALGWCLAILAGSFNSESWGSIAMTMALIAVALQAGYVAGIALRRLMAASRLNRRRAWAGKRATVVSDSAY